MKIFITSFAILNLLIANCHSQETKASDLIKVSEKKEIYRQSNPALIIMERSSSTDTFYYIMFRNLNYSSITSFEGLTVTKEELKTFVDGFTEFMDEKYKGKDAKIEINKDGIISKNEDGDYRITLMDAGLSWTYVNKKQIIKIKEIIYKYFSY